MKKTEFLKTVTKKELLEVALIKIRIIESLKSQITILQDVINIKDDTIRLLNKHLDKRNVHKY